MARVRFDFDTFRLDAELLDTPTARAIAAALPIASSALTWGEEVYFEVPVEIAREQGARAVLVNDDPEEDDENSRSKSDWVLVSRDPAALKRQPIVDGGAEPAEDRPGWRTWTDDYSNLVQIMK